MKRLIPVIALMLFCFTAFAQGGVNFQHLTFDEALAKAKAENKLVFVDCYTTWCGPCKYMTNTIFPQEKAGEFFNPRFVCVKFDMEQPDGKVLGEKFGVKAYPTFLILHPDGTVQHKVVGGGDLDDFIARIERGLNEKTSLEYLDKLYAKGKMNKKQLLAYRIALNDAYDKEKSKKVNEELNAQLKEKDKLKADFWPLIEEKGYGTDEFKLVLANLPKFRKNVGKEKVDAYLRGCYSNALNNCMYSIRKDGASRFNTIREELAKLDFDKKNELDGKVELVGACAEGNAGNVIAVVEKLVPAAQGNEKWMMISALGSIKDKATKAELDRIVAFGDKLAADAKGEEKEYISAYFEPFKIAAHEGVYFQELPFEKALEKAKRQRKMLFIDCYTSWCGPCKYMTAKIFPQKEAGEYFNKEFICLKYDMEKGEGPKLREKFGVKAFPTFVILKSDGTVWHKLVGSSSNADDFIVRVQKGVKEENALGAMQAKYKEGKKDKEFLTKYVGVLAGLHDESAVTVAEELFNVLSDEERVSSDYWFIFRNSELSPKGSALEKYLLANRAKFNQNIDKKKVDERLSEDYIRRLMMIFGGNDKTTGMKELNAMSKEITALKLENAKMLQSYLTIARSVVGGNKDRIITTCERELVKLPDARMPFYYLNAGLRSGLTDAQQARWEKLGKKL